MTTWQAHHYLFWPVILGAGIALAIYRFAMRDTADARNWRPDVLVGGVAVLLVLYALISVFRA